MLHELLLALLGYTGDFVIDEREQSKTLGISDPQIASDEPSFKLAVDLSFIQPSERSAIERLISLGFYYRELNRFATVSRNLTSVQTTKDSPTQRTSDFTGKSGKSSIYRRAIANGIVEILSVYKTAVLQVEQNLLSDPVPILSTVTQGLNKFDVLLSPLYELIMEIEREDIRGGQLLNLLHKRRHCGVPELQACFQRLLWHGHQVLYNQLASWMVYGILQDQHGEFFIRRQDDRDLESESSHPDSIEKLMQKPSEDPSLSDWHQGFHIYLDMLPEYIHMRVAESILFAGKAVRVLRNPSPSFRLQDSFIQQPTFRGSQRGQNFLGGFAPQGELLKEMNLIAQELLPQSEADKIETMLQDLKKSSEFHKRLFESAVNSIRTIAANHLWQLVVIRADLIGHLKALKDYFLLAKGDFFQCFLEESCQLMRLPPRQSTAEADLMVPFQLVDVIESQWNVLQAHVQNSHDFTELVSFHQEYLSALISQSFLDIGSVSRILDSIMKLCLQFCWNIENYESNPNLSELEHITEEFNKKSNSLYTILRSSRLAGSQRAPFLRQLLMRLNFNSFFEEYLRFRQGCVAIIDEGMAFAIVLCYVINVNWWLANEGWFRCPDWVVGGPGPRSRKCLQVFVV